MTSTASKFGIQEPARLPGGATAPPDPPEKRLRRARQPVSSSPSYSARKIAPNHPDEALQGGV
eukprot:8667187-Alexandrium_andersonii.AAC.1